MVTVEYQVDAKHREAFLRSVENLDTSVNATVLMRGKCSKMPADDGRFFETFLRRSTNFLG
jgi:hypothetical protein